MIDEAKLKAGIAGVIDYAMAVLEKTPEALFGPIEKQGPKKAIPQFIAAMIKQIYSKDKQIRIEVVIGGVIGIYGEIDRMLIESGNEMAPEEKAQLTSKCIEITLGANPMLQKQFNNFKEELEGMDPEEVKRMFGVTEEAPMEEPEIPMEAQQVPIEQQEGAF